MDVNGIGMAASEMLTWRFASEQPTITHQIRGDIAATSCSIVQICQQYIAVLFG